MSENGEKDIILMAVFVVTRDDILSCASELGIPEEQVTDEVIELVKEEVRAARMATPINLDYDPKGEGYRRITASGDQAARDLSPLSQDLMIELAYYLYDTSGL